MKIDEIQLKRVAMRITTVLSVAVLLLFWSGCKQESAPKPKSAEEQQLDKLKEEAKESIQPGKPGAATPKAKATRLARPKGTRRARPKGKATRLAQPKQTGPKEKAYPRPPAPRKVEKIELPTEPTPAELAKRKAAKEAQAKAKEMEARQKAIDQAAKKESPKPKTTQPAKPAPTTKPAAEKK